MLLEHLCADCASPNPSVYFCRDGAPVAEVLCRACASEAAKEAERSNRSYDLCLLSDIVDKAMPLTVRVSIVALPPADDTAATPESEQQTANE